MLRWLTQLRHSSGSEKERRRELRRFLKLPIEVRGSTAISYRGYTRDLSPTGMGAVVSAALNVGEKVWIKYDHPSKGEQKASAVVRHGTVRQRHGYRYGFEFDVPLDL